MAILDARTAGNPPTHSPGKPTSSATGKPLIAGGVLSGKGKRRPISKAVPLGSRKMLPPVATAEPPKMSDIEYDNDGWCIICYEDMYEEDSSTLNCGHRFHSEVSLSPLSKLSVTDSCLVPLHCVCYSFPSSVDTVHTIMVQWTEHMPHLPKPLPLAWRVPQSQVASHTLCWLPNTQNIFNYQVLVITYILLTPHCCYCVVFMMIFIVAIII